MKPYDYWLQRNWYYHQYLAAYYRFLIPAGKRILQVGCKTGFILDAVQPSYGVGVDTEPASIDTARKKYPKYQFFSMEVDQLPITSQFDTIILSSATMETDDIQALFTALHRFCTPDTRIIIEYYSTLWSPILWTLQKLGIRRPMPLKNWIRFRDLENFLYLTDFQAVMHTGKLLLPMYIPLVSTFFNRYIAALPFVSHFCLSQWVVARPVIAPSTAQQTVSVIIPCKNEQGNIEAIVTRTPAMGRTTELIFVEGHSQDGTIAEIIRVQAKYPDTRITYFVQSGTGKANAVRLGFEKATGDILMILDADMTVPPESLPKFYQALVQRKGEFINGSRLVYNMESEAMRFLNMIANYLFGHLFSWILGQPVKDTLCGTKVLFKTDYQKIDMSRKADFGKFDPFGDFDLLFGAAKHNLKIVDMPVHYKNRTYGTTQIRRFYHGMILLRMSVFGFRKFKLR